MQLVLESCMYVLSHQHHGSVNNIRVKESVRTGILQPSNNLRGNEILSLVCLDRFKEL